MSIIKQIKKVNILMADVTKKVLDKALAKLNVCKPSPPTIQHPLFMIQSIPDG